MLLNKNYLHIFFILLLIYFLFKNVNQTNIEPFSQPVTLCDPNSDPIQYCPNGKPCPQCGSASCMCNHKVSVNANNKEDLDKGVFCNPNTDPMQYCPSGKPCPQCGKDSCPCSGGSVPPVTPPPQPPVTPPPQPPNMPPIGPPITPPVTPPVTLMPGTIVTTKPPVTTTKPPATSSCMYDQTSIPMCNTNQCNTICGSNKYQQIIGKGCSNNCDISLTYMGRPGEGQNDWKTNVCDRSLCNKNSEGRPTFNTQSLDNPQNYNIEFLNNTNDTMHVGIIKNQAYNYKNGDWTFNITSPNEDIKSPQTNIVTQPSFFNNNIDFYTINKDCSLRFKCNKQILKWISGNSIVIKNKPTNVDSFTYVGLTNLEWTLDHPNANNTLNTDISAASGINLQVDVTIFNGINCDTDNNKGTRGCNFDFSKCKNVTSDNGINKCISPGQPGANLSAKSIQKQNNILKTSSCGIDNSCAGCATGPDKCPKGSNVNTNCAASDIKDRWGCYRWWNDPNNDQAQDWLNMFDQSCPIYGWAYDELTLTGNGVSSNWINTTYDNYNINCSYIEKSSDSNANVACSSYENSLLYKCQFNPNDPECLSSKQPYLKKNKKDPLTTCGEVKSNTLLRFTINKIL